MYQLAAKIIQELHAHFPDIKTVWDAVRAEEIVLDVLLENEDVEELDIEDEEVD